MKRDSREWALRITGGSRDGERWKLVRGLRLARLHAACPITFLRGNSCAGRFIAFGIRIRRGLPGTASHMTWNAPARLWTIYNETATGRIVSRNSSGNLNHRWLVIPP